MYEHLQHCFFLHIVLFYSLTHVLWIPLIQFLPTVTFSSTIVSPDFCGSFCRLLFFTLGSCIPFTLAILCKDITGYVKNWPKMLKRTCLQRYTTVIKPTKWVGLPVTCWVALEELYYGKATHLSIITYTLMHGTG